MKKLISILLAIVLVVGIILGVIFMTNSDKEDPTQPTIAPTEEVVPPDTTTESQVESLPESEPEAEPDYPTLSEIDNELQAAEAPVLSWPSNDTFTIVTKGLGFKEIDFAKHVIGDEQNYYDKNGNIVYSPIPSATVHNIQFIENKTRIELSWYSLEYNMEEDWVMYCTKADGVADISGINIDDYDGCYSMNLAETFQEWAEKDFVQFYQYTYYKGIEAWAEVYAYYYPQSGNLYNFVKTYDHIPEVTNSPDVLYKDADATTEYMLDSDFDLNFVDGYPIITSEFGISCEGQVEYYKYRVGMTLSNWAASEFNTSGWILGLNNTICSPDYQYQIPGFDNSITVHSDFLDDGIFEAGASDSYYTSTMTTIMSEPLPSVPVARLIDWQSPLLVDGFAIVGKHNQDVISTYGYQMFNMGEAYEAGENLDIYIKNIQPDMLTDVRLYVLNESELLDNMTIPDGATYVTFEESPNPIEHSRDKMAVAHYNMAEDPNFDAKSSNIFALTYKDKIVYWIQMPTWVSAQAE